jgi:hypothetical protein
MKMKKGDLVEWKSRGHLIRGTIESIIMCETKIKSHCVAASPDNPEYLVKSEKTGSIAAHHPEALKKTMS